MPERLVITHRKDSKRSFADIMMRRTLRLATQAREYNKTLSAEDQKAFYLGGMNAIAAKFWELARKKKPNVQELKLYADLLLRHFEQGIKETKNTVALRQLKLLEAKAQALQDLAKDRTLPDVQYFHKFRQLMYPNGHSEPQKLLEEESS
jgi:hypothetical protein